MTAVPEPNACRWCGDDQHHHGWQYHPEAGLHQWTEPTDEQRLQRMRARRQTTTSSKEQ